MQTEPYTLNGHIWTSTYTVKRQYDGRYYIKAEHYSYPDYVLLNDGATLPFDSRQQAINTARYMMDNHIWPIK